MIKNAFISALLLTAVQIVQADPLHLDTEKPRAGQRISFNYAAGSGKLAGAADVHAALFYYTATKVTGYYAEDIDLKLAGKENYKGSFILPDSAVAFAIRLRSGKITEDNGGRGYISLVYSRGVPVPGSYGGAALLFGNAESLLGLPNKADTAMAMLEKELALHPELRGKYESSWYTNLVSVQKQAAYPQLDQRALELLSAPGAGLTDYKLAIRLYQLQKKKKTADSVIDLAAARFPGSELAVQHAENEFYKIRDLDSLAAYYTDFSKNFAGVDPKDPAVEAGSYFAATISSRYIQKKEYRKAIGYAAGMNDVLADYRGYMYSWVALELLKSDSATGLADSLVQAALAGLDYEAAHPEKFKRPGITLRDWKEDLNNYYYAAFFDTYAKVLVQKGDHAKALEVQQKSVELSGGKNNGFNEHYVRALLRAGDVKKAKERAAAYIQGNNASDSVRIWFKDLYVKENGSDKGYDAYLAGLMSVAKTKFREQALKEKMDLPSKPFSLPGIDGKEVSLASLRGKVVVVDFWATWCGPCKASFPAMQTAINNYQKDTNVVFLFIDTWESTGADERFSAVKKFIADNKYSFHVLLDKVVDLEKRQYSMVSEYGVGGIPTKFVINPQGKVVFKAVGFDGNNEKLVTELSVYIELAKG